MRKVAWRDDPPAGRPARSPEDRKGKDGAAGKEERHIAWKEVPPDPNRKRAWKDAPEKAEQKEPARNHPAGTEQEKQKRPHPAHSGKRRRRRLLIAGILFGVLALAGFGVFVKEFRAYRKAADYYARLSAFVERDLEPPQDAAGGVSEAGNGSAAEAGNGAAEAGNGAAAGHAAGNAAGSRFGKVRGSSLDFSNLRRMNPDVAGWLSIPQIRFSGPVVWCGNNTTYLDKAFDWTESPAGCPFLAADAASDFSLPYSLIYGRNMHNGTMFGQLDRYRKKSFFEKHPTFLLYTPRQDYACTVFSCYRTEDASEVYRMDWKDGGEYSAFLERIKAASAYDTGVSVFPGDKVLTLSTCGSAYTGGKDRFVVHAVMRRIE